MPHRLTVLVLALCLIAHCALFQVTPTHASHARVARITAVASWSGFGNFYYLRAGTSSSSAILGQVAQGDPLQVLAGLAGESENGNPWWYRVTLGHTGGYVSSNAVDIVSVPRSSWTTIATNDGDLSLGEISASRSPSQTAPVAAHYALGTKFTVDGVVQGDPLEAGNTSWYRISQGSLPPVYVYSSYLKFVNIGSTAIPVPEVGAASMAAVDVDSGKLLYGLQPTVERRPASTVKLMTALVALQHLKPDAVLTVPNGVQSVTTEVGGSAMGLVAGESLTLRQLLYGMLLPSGNDAAYTVASAVGGTQGTFVRMMNQAAMALGLRQTPFYEFNWAG